MDNREKALQIAARLRNTDDRLSLACIIEDELNRLDAPTPKKWEPRGGNWNATINIGVIEAVSCEGSRIAGREYPTKEEAECAAPLHRKMDRLVNWLVEHCGENLSSGITIDTSMIGHLAVLVDVPGLIQDRLKRGTNSGEVEL